MLERKDIFSQNRGQHPTDFSMVGKVTRCWFVTRGWWIFSRIRYLVEITFNNEHLNFYREHYGKVRFHNGRSGELPSAITIEVSHAKFMKVKRGEVMGITLTQGRELSRFYGGCTTIYIVDVVEAY